MNLLLAKTEAAFVALLTTPCQAVDATCVVAGSQATETKTLPLVGVDADGDAEEDPKLSGNYWVNVVVSARTKAVADGTTTDPATTSQNMVSAVEGVLMVDDLPSQLSAAVADFTVFPCGVIYSSPTSTSDEDAWVNEFRMRVYCCASDLAP